MSPLFTQQRSQARDALATRDQRVDIQELLRARRQIAPIWSVEDVIEVRPDLSDDQAWDVLQEVDRRKDAECGIHWDTLRDYAEMLFPATDGGES